VPAGDYVSVVVRDTGTGIPPDQLGKAVQPFYTTKEIGQGSGLGLSMVYGFTRQSGGGVRIRSRPGEGTEVTIYLPRHVADDTAATIDELPVVLLVEDEAEVRSVIGGLLRRIGYAVADASDATAALEWLQSERRIDLMLSDLGLPGNMDGRSLAREARLHRPGLEILFCSGNPSVLPEDASGDLANFSVLTKPFRKKDLARYLKRMGGPASR